MSKINGGEMNMILTQEYVERLRDELSRRPLQHGELRRLVGLGEQYIALSSTVVDVTYTNLLTLSIDGLSCTVYARTDVEHSS